MKKGLKSMLLAGVVGASLLTSGCNLLNNEGVKWHTGETVPTSETGNDGDFYFDLTTNKTYYKQNGEWKEKVVSNRKDITKIEKVDTSDNSNTYKITYADGSTETFEVEKDADLIDHTQEELFEEFKTISANSMAKPYYSAFLNINGDGYSDTGYMTTDENGSYMAIPGEHYVYYIKEGNKYVRYSDEIDGDPRSRYVTQEEWEEARQNIIVPFNNGEPILEGIHMRGIFTAQSIDEVSSLMRIFALGFGNDMPNPIVTVQLSENFDELINKDKLLLEIKITGGEIEGVGHSEKTFKIESYSNEIKKITYYRQGYDQLGEPLDDFLSVSYDIEYIPNINLVPSEEDLKEFPEPTE